MFDIGWIEMAVIAMVALVVIGPKDLPRVMKTVGQWAQKARGLAREFQSGLNDMVREAELEEARNAIKSVTDTDVKKTITDTVDPTGDLTGEMRSIGDSVEREPTAGDDKAAASGAEAGGEPENGGATIIKQPVQMAPPHSIRPPDEDGPSLPKAAAGSDKD